MSINTINATNVNKGSAKILRMFIPVNDFSDLSILKILNRDLNREITIKEPKNRNTKATILLLIPYLFLKIYNKNLILTLQNNLFNDFFKYLTIIGKLHYRLYCEIDTFTQNQKYLQ